MYPFLAIYLKMYTSKIKKQIKKTQGLGSRKQEVQESSKKLTLTQGDIGTAGL